MAEGSQAAASEAEAVALSKVSEKAIARFLGLCRTRSYWRLWNRCLVTVGQNSANALPPIRPAKPRAVRRQASPTPDSLSARQVFERKLLPEVPMYRA